jgi:hypothetical protein
MNSKFKTDLKAWLRKYPTPKEQQKHPFEEFTREKGVFENVKEAVKLFLTNYGLTMYTQTQTTGNLTVSHYMTLLQKLTSLINKDLMIAYFNLPKNYNFKVDVKNIRLRNNQKDYNRYVLQTNPQELNRIIQYINSNMDQISRSDVPSIFKYINDISGYTAIQFDPKNLLVNTLSSSSSGSVHKYAIVDNDLQKKMLLRKYGSIDIYLLIQDRTLKEIQKNQLNSEK